MSKEWKLVPVEPTEEMLRAHGCNFDGLDDDQARAEWAALLAAAPVPPRSDVQPVAWLTSDGRQLVFEGVLDQSQYIEQGMRPLVHAADAGEADRLREELESHKEALREEMQDAFKFQQRALAAEQRNSEVVALLHMAKELLSTISMHKTMSPADWCEIFKSEVVDRIGKIDAALSASTEPANKECAQ